MLLQDFPHFPGNQPEMFSNNRHIPGLSSCIKAGLGNVICMWMDPLPKHYVVDPLPKHCVAMCVDPLPKHYVT